MSKVDEMRTFEGTLALPYEGLDTNSFDDAVWSAPLGQPQKAESQWGFHLILVKERGAGPRAIMGLRPHQSMSVSSKSKRQKTPGSRCDETHFVR